MRFVNRPLERNSRVDFELLVKSAYCAARFTIGTDRDEAIGRSRE